MSGRPPSSVVQTPPSSRLRQVLAAGLAEKKAQESKPAPVTGASTSSAVSDTYDAMWGVIEALKKKVEVTLKEGGTNNDGLLKLKERIVSIIEDRDRDITPDVLGGELETLESELAGQVERNSLDQTTIKELKQELEVVNGQVALLKNELSVEQSYSANQQLELSSKLSKVENELEQAQIQIDGQNDRIRDLRQQLKSCANSVTIGIPVELGKVFEAFAEKSAASGFDDVSVLSKLLTSKSASARDLRELATSSLRSAQSLEDDISKEDFQYIKGIELLVFGQESVYKLLKDNGKIDQIEVQQQNESKLVEATRNMTQNLKDVPAEVKSRWFNANGMAVLRYICYVLLFVMAISLMVFYRQPAALPAPEPVGWLQWGVDLANKTYELIKQNDFKGGGGLGDL